MDVCMKLALRTAPDWDNPAFYGQKRWEVKDIHWPWMPLDKEVEAAQAFWGLDMLLTHHPLIF